MECRGGQDPSLFSLGHLLNPYLLHTSILGTSHKPVSSHSLTTRIVKREVTASQTMVRYSPLRPNTWNESFEKAYFAIDYIRFDTRNTLIELDGETKIPKIQLQLEFADCSQLKSLKWTNPDLYCSPTAGVIQHRCIHVIPSFV
jgi:hypothetical protein